jgi:DNA processing protein
LTPGIGNVGARALLSAFGLPDSIFCQTPAVLGTVVSEKIASQVLIEPEQLPALLANTLQWLDADPLQRRVLSLGDPMYPKALLDISDPPLLLYAIASPAFWELGHWPERTLAVVGSRNPTPQGIANAHAFSRDLAQRGICVVSGLALGIDGAAHEGSLSVARSGVRTVAVVGTGLDRVYPAQHRALAHQIAQHGVLLSEYHLGTPPLAANFPKRNRLLCGLSQGVLVVEAALQSGSLITARLGADQGIEVFAIPGSIHSPQAKGCHALIRQGAKLVESAQDILEELPLWQTPGSSPVAANVQSATAVSTPEAPTQTVDCPVLLAMGFDPVRLEALQVRTGWAVGPLQARLMELELSLRVARLPGGLFQRCVQA